MNWKSVVGAVAPTLAASLGGPLAGAAVGALAKVLGCDPTEPAVAKAVAAASPEVLAAMRQADQEFQVRMAELGLEPEKIAAADRDSARAMQRDTRSWAPGVISAVVVIGFFAVVGYLLAFGAPKEDAGGIIFLLVGTLTAGFTQVLSFFLGSSKSSQEKDAHIRHMWDTTP